jgi:hypothetical protein
MSEANGSALKENIDKAPASTDLKGKGKAVEDVSMDEDDSSEEEIDEVSTESFVCIEDAAD